jgi:isopropylmalate/homocitrate/citramalate synthase
MNDWPRRVAVREVGPREGFQSHEAVIATDVKEAVLRRILESGVTKVNAVSLVSPKAMPQMADAEELLRRVGPVDGVVMSALAPNPRAVARALALAEDGLLQEILLINAMTRSVLEANGIHATRDEWRDAIVDMAKTARDAELRTVVFLSASFGCSIEGPVEPAAVMAEAERLYDSGVVDEIVISDSTGQAGPHQAHAMFTLFAERFGAAPVTAHFHDSRGMAVANVAATLRAGLDTLTVDAAFGGLGGDVPFLPEAAGNLATEELLTLCAMSGIETGIDVAAIVEAAEIAQRAYGDARAFPSKVLALGAAA